MAKSRGLSPADLRLWAEYSERIPVLLPGKTRLKLPPQPPEPAPAAVTAAPETVAKKQKSVIPAKIISIGAGPVGLDKSTWQKFTSGKIRAGRKLDLHGHTASRAHHAVTNFIERAYAEQIRCVEIVTGKGEILARELPHWLNAPALRPLILAIAHPHAGNTGALRLLLRRLR